MTASERPSTPRVPRSRRGIGALHPTAGSAYLATLLALVVLTILGLSLALVTQTEMRIGANEQIIQRVFYSADSGVAAITSRALVTGDYRGLELTMPAEERAGVTFQDNVEVSPFVPISSGYCNLCAINQGSDFYQINHGLNATAGRTGTDAGGDVVQQAEKLISVMVEVQPWERTIVDLGEFDLSKLKF